MPGRHTAGRWWRAGQPGVQRAPRSPPPCPPSRADPDGVRPGGVGKLTLRRSARSRYAPCRCAYTSSRTRSPHGEGQVAERRRTCGDDHAPAGHPIRKRAGSRRHRRDRRRGRGGAPSRPARGYGADRDRPGGRGRRRRRGPPLRRRRHRPTHRPPSRRRRCRRSHPHAPLPDGGGSSQVQDEGARRRPAGRYAHRPGGRACRHTGEHRQSGGRGRRCAGSSYADPDGARPKRQAPDRPSQRRVPERTTRWATRSPGRREPTPAADPSSPWRDRGTSSAETATGSAGRRFTSLARRWCDGVAAPRGWRPRPRGLRSAAAG